ncbi:MAG: hypothetical protein ACNA8W_02740 [Bradymonadaceae bacterium]
MKAVEDICRDHGLSIEGIEVDGEVLCIAPASLADLPDGEALRRLGEEIQGLGYRYVTLQVLARDRE